VLNRSRLTYSQETQYFDSPLYQQLPEHIFHIDSQNHDAPVCDDLINNIRTATAQDNELTTLTNLIKHDWNISNCTTYDKYKHFQDELSIDNAIVYKGLRAIIPKALQRKFLQLLHTGHNGINSTLRRPRHTVFWLGITKDILNNIASCRQCQMDAPRQQKETLTPHNSPTTLDKSRNRLV